ncbi:hypothetical protein [Spirosoma koreense]
MGALKRINIDSAYREVSGAVDQLALYDKYSAMAYGIILTIIPEPEVAQKVLMDLFASPPLSACPEAPTAGEIIRLARTKALAAKSVSVNLPDSPIPFAQSNDAVNIAEIVFNLSFCQGYTPEAVAEKLNLSTTNVFKAFYSYFKHLRSS